MKDRIRERMRDLRISQDDLAERMGVSQPMITKYLNGAKTRKLLEMASALSCTPEYLQHGGQPPQAVFDTAKSSQRNVSKIEIKGFVPLLSYVQAGSWTEVVDLYEPGHATLVAEI